MLKEPTKKKGTLYKYKFFYSVIRALKLLYGISKFYFNLSIILTFLLGLSSALIIYSTKILINGLQIGINDTKHFFAMLSVYGLINIGVSIVKNFQDYISEKHRLYVNSQLDILFLEKCKNLELKDFEDEHSYNIISRANELGREKIYGLYINLLALLQSIKY